MKTRMMRIVRRTIRTRMEPGTGIRRGGKKRLLVPKTWASLGLRPKMRRAMGVFPGRGLRRKAKMIMVKRNLIRDRN